ncbi:MAG TPA: protein-L-isoaspartate O-methyltransferase [Casimicrobiaceae bacterium]|nr:protein-L-isoaspartate O-methyltransferase [Casimicrobiaceae bacterium]
MSSFSIEQARFNMVEQQIRTWEVLDQDVLDLLFKVKREEFVPAGCESLAFADLEIPLGHGEHMWTPKMEARVLQELSLRPSERVLEVGTGSGYLTALLASRADTVLSVEIVPEFARSARTKLARAGIRNVDIVEGDGARGFETAAYDAIVLTGSTPLIAESLFAQLKPGGRIFAVVGDPPIMTARLVQWTAPGSRVTRGLFETLIAPLRNAPAPRRFEF